MGLDMYLSKKTYVKNWDHADPKDRHTVSVTGPHAAQIKPERIAEITEEVGYWRKANAIHKWFVDHCQDGIDDCREVYVGAEQLAQLRDVCRALLAGEVKPEDALPTVEGFFFGNTGYDEDYWQDVTDTESLLSGLLEESQEADFYYRASW